MAGGDGFEGSLEPGIGFDAVQLGGLDERGNTPSRGGAFVVTCEQRVFLDRAIGRARFSMALLSIWTRLSARKSWRPSRKLLSRVLDKPACRRWYFGSGGGEPP